MNYTFKGKLFKFGLFWWHLQKLTIYYTSLVGVYSEQDGRTYWPREITVRTDPTGPPLVDTPEFVDSRSYGTAELKLKVSSKNYFLTNQQRLVRHGRAWAHQPLLASCYSRQLLKRSSNQC